MHSLWDSLIWLPCGGVTSKLHIGRIPCFANALFKIQGFSKKKSQNCDNCPPADKKGLWVLSGGIPENVCSLYKCLIFMWSVGSKESIIFLLKKNQSICILEILFELLYYWAIWIFVHSKCINMPENWDISVCKNSNISSFSWDKKIDVWGY